MFRSGRDLPCATCNEALDHASPLPYSRDREAIMTLIKFAVRTRLIGSELCDEVEIDDWEDMSQEEQEKLMFEILCDSGMFEWNYEAIE